MSQENTIDLPAFYAVKAGMTRIFNDAGDHVPVTVLKLIPNVISQVKTKEKDGYEAYQLAYYEKRGKLTTKPVKGTLKKAGIAKNLSLFAEVKMDGVAAENVGKEISVKSFESAYVDVTGTSKGKGFAGVMKRHGFQGGPAAHGSHFHRGPGSIGQRATPARVFPERKMPGHMGVEKVTIQNIKIVEINLEKGYLLVKGSVPGAKNSFVRVSRARKMAGV